MEKFIAKIWQLLCSEIYMEKMKFDHFLPFKKKYCMDISGRNFELFKLESFYIVLFIYHFVRDKLFCGISKKI